MAPRAMVFDVDVTTGQWVLLIAVAAALAFGAWRAATDGRFRGTHRVRDARAASTPQTVSTGLDSNDDPSDELASGPEADDSVVAGTPYADQLGERATLLQFSSAFCAPCRATRRTLEDVTGLFGDVAHVEVDAESHLELVRKVGVTRTPTTLILDSAGREVTRAAGAPTRQQVLSALDLTSNN